MDTFAFIGAKGGVGNTVSALLAAASIRRSGREVILADLTGDMGVLLGVAPDLPGITEWTATEELSPGAVSALAVDVSPGISLLPLGNGVMDPSGLGTLWQVLARDSRITIVDAGRGLRAFEKIQGNGVHTLLTMACCYQSMHHARRVVGQDDVGSVIMLADNERRALGPVDIEAALSRNADAVIPFDRAISRWADSGLLLDRWAKAADRLDELMLRLL